MEQTKTAGGLTPETRLLGAADAQPIPPLPGEVPKAVGHYRLLQELGRGGMGVVYKGWDEHLDRPAAIKLISPAIGAHGDAIERLRSEAKAVAQLSHQNIVAIYAFNYEGTTPYIAMEFVEGRDLGQVLKHDGPLEPRRAVEIIRQAAVGLAFASQRNIVHRDIKPANLFLTGDGVVKVMDFGLARRLDVDSNLTGTGNTVGTPNYMSPEQVLARTVDHRSDIYSLGCTLFTLLSGKQPFIGNSAMEIMMKHVNSPMEWPREWKDRLLGRIRNVIARMTHKDPAGRYQTWQEVIADLDAVLTDRPTTAPRAARSLPKPIAIIGLLAGGVAVLLAGVYFGGLGGATPSNTPVTPITNSRSAVNTPRDQPPASGTSSAREFPREVIAPIPAPQAPAAAVVERQAPPLAAAEAETLLREQLLRGDWEEAEQTLARHTGTFFGGNHPAPRDVVLRDISIAIDKARNMERKLAGEKGRFDSPERRAEAAITFIRSPRSEKLEFMDAQGAVLLLVFSRHQETLTYAKLLHQHYAQELNASHEFAIIFFSAVLMAPGEMARWRAIHQGPQPMGQLPGAQRPGGEDNTQRRPIRPR